MESLLGQLTYIFTTIVLAARHWVVHVPGVVLRPRLMRGAGPFVFTQDVGVDSVAERILGAWRQRTFARAS